MNVVGRPLFYVKPLLQGPPGSLVKLRVFRLGAGETTITLVRHLSNNTGGLLGTPDPTAPPVHRLVRWDDRTNMQISEVCPLSKNTPRGYVDILIIDVQNLPVAYEMGWAVSSTLLGSILCNPYVVAKQVRGATHLPFLSLTLSRRRRGSQGLVGRPSGANKRSRHGGSLRGPRPGDVTYRSERGRG